MRESAASHPRPAKALFVMKDHDRILTVADACRRAASKILGEDTSRWGSSELAAWRTGPYHEATHRGPKRGTVCHEDFERLTTAEVQERLHCARSFVAARVEMAWDNTRQAFASAIEDGLVIRARDVSGQGGFLPAVEAGVPLGDRVLSLVIADYLTRPQDYRHSLRVCAECEGALLDESCACPRHASSGVRFALDPADLPSVATRARAG